MSFDQDPSERTQLETQLDECIAEIHSLKSRNEKLEKVAMRAKDVRIFAELLDEALADLEQP